MYWTGFTLITCKNLIAGPIVNTQSVVVLVWIILGVSIKHGLCYDIPESLYGRTGIPYREHRTAVYRYISVYRYTPMQHCFAQGRFSPKITPDTRSAVGDLFIGPR